EYSMIGYASGGVRQPSTAHDRRLSEINAALAKSILVWGNATKKAADNKKVNDITGLTAELAADRAGFFARDGRVASFDLLESMRTGKIKLAGLKDEELPAEMQKMTLKERRDYLDKVARKRVELYREAVDLDKKRGVLLNKELAKTKDRFDTA